MLRGIGVFRGLRERRGALPGPPFRVVSLHVHGHDDAIPMPSIERDRSSAEIVEDHRTDSAGRRTRVERNSPCLDRHASWAFLLAARPRKGIGSGAIRNACEASGIVRDRESMWGVLGNAAGSQAIGRHPGMAADRDLLRRAEGGREPLRRPRFYRELTPWRRGATSGRPWHWRGRSSGSGPM
jgi:hypothetical protein